MGNLCSCTDIIIDKESKDKHDFIERELKKDLKILNKEIKILLLGTGESGKSTIAKQMKIIYLNGFTVDEVINYKPVVHTNTISSIKILLQANRRFCSPRNSYKENNEILVEKYLQMNPLSVELTSEMAKEILTLWNEESIQEIFKRRNEFQLFDGAEYCFENIERFSNFNYIPTIEDCLRCRARTTGIIEIKFKVDDVIFRIIDVGGQRSERKKWIHCFQDVTVIIFCVALNEYDMKLNEDESVNRMLEALELFDEISNNTLFVTMPIVLFLNKSDLFAEKIAKKDLKCCFPDYTGGCDFLNGTIFIQEKFMSSCRKDINKKIYSHITCATDTENIKFVFNSVKDIILNDSLQSF